MADDDDWDDALGERAQQTVSPDVVRKLLQMNPALRARGMDTGMALEQMNQAQAQKTVENAKPKSTGTTQKPATQKPMTGKPTTGAPGGQNDVMAALKELKLRQQAGNKRIDDELAKLKKAREDLAAGLRDQWIDWLLANDPDMRSPVTQGMLEKEKDFLQQIGFTVKGYIEHRTRTGK